MNSSQQARASVREAAAYLRYCGIHLPRFKVTTEPPESMIPIANSFVDESGGELRLNMGRYPTRFLRRWFSMHELGHILWHFHRPLRWKRFREEFGEPPPDDYDDLAAAEAWKTAATWKFSRKPGIHRPKGQPSWYGARAGGAERFCELLGLMWANGDFATTPPRDLADLWEVCWDHGLARMT